MGGSSSGRDVYKRFRTLDDLLTIDLAVLNRKRVLEKPCSAKIEWQGGRNKRQAMSLHYDGNCIEFEHHEHVGSGLSQARNHKIYFTTTKCKLSGVRRWFICPRCQERARKLFFFDNKLICRKCTRLPYRCQSESRRDRLLRRSAKLRSKINADTEFGSAIYDEDKPPKMRWKTFDKICNEIEEVELEEQMLWVNALHKKRWFSSQ